MIRRLILAIALAAGAALPLAAAPALALEPEIILMDEPLGALDKGLRDELQLEIRALHHKTRVTILFVTHDQSEALAMSDRVW